MTEGRAATQIKEAIGVEFRRNIDEKVAGHKLGTQLRAAFPGYPWGVFFTEAKDHFRQFLDSIHDAVENGAYEQKREKVSEMRKDYLHHLEQRLDELRDSVN